MMEKEGRRIDKHHVGVGHVYRSLAWGAANAIGARSACGWGEMQSNKSSRKQKGEGDNNTGGTFLCINSKQDSRQ